ncbi:MAG: HEAT repeat domain-containing protein [Candidatus Acidiferrales bacterium]
MRSTWRRLLTVVAVAVMTVLPLAERADGIPGPMIDLTTLISNSTLIVTGTVASLEIGSPQQVVEGSQRFEARAVTGSIEVDQAIKGEPKMVPTRFTYLLPEAPRGWRSVGLHQYAIFFFGASEKGLFHFTSRYYPYILVAPGSSATGSEPIDRVVSLLSSTASSSKARDAQRLSVIRMLATVKAPASVAALRTLLTSGPVALRVAVAAALLRGNDLSGLDLVTNVLLQKPPDVPDTIIQDAVAAVGWGLTSPQAIPKIEELLASSDPEVRRAGTSSLMRIGSPLAIKSLQSELQDSDFQTRYFAVVALAQITHQSEWRPTIGEFRTDENKYLGYWERWDRTQNQKQ